MKTVLAPGAPWYEPEPPPVVKIKKPKAVKKKPKFRRANPKVIDSNFEQWLESIKKVTK